MRALQATFFAVLKLTVACAGSGVFAVELFQVELM